MRGDDNAPESLFSYVNCEARVPSKHPLRQVRKLCDRALEALSPDFSAVYSDVGRRSIAPEKLLRALLLQAFYGIRSERQLMEQLDYNLLFRWFVGLSMDAQIWDVTVFTKNRQRLLDGDIAQKFLAAVVADARQHNLLSDEHFSVDGTMIEAWASMKSFKPKDGGDQPPGPGRNADRNFHGEKRSNETHASTTDPDSRLYRKGNGQSSQLAYLGHVLMENRNCLVAATDLTCASGTAEREAALEMLDKLARDDRQITLGADKGYDASTFVDDLKQRKVSPHIARNNHETKTGKRRKSAVDDETAATAGYAVSLRIRKRIEEIFGWMKSTAGLRKTRHVGKARVAWAFTLTAAAYNLMRMPKLMSAA